MSGIYLRETSLSDLEGSTQLMELPFYSKYLLLASYIASHNPSRMDRRFFSKVESAEYEIASVQLLLLLYKLKQPKLRKPRGHKTVAEVSSIPQATQSLLSGVF